MSPSIPNFQEVMQAYREAVIVATLNAVEGTHRSIRDWFEPVSSHAGLNVTLPSEESCERIRELRKLIKPPHARKRPVTPPTEPHE